MVTLNELETFKGNKYVYGPDGTDGFTGVHTFIPKFIKLQTFNMESFCMSNILQKKGVFLKRHILSKSTQWLRKIQLKNAVFANKSPDYSHNKMLV